MPFAQPYRCRACDWRELVFRMAESLAAEETEPAPEAPAMETLPAEIPAKIESGRAHSAKA